VEDWQEAVNRDLEMLAKQLSVTVWQAAEVRSLRNSAEHTPELEKRFVSACRAGYIVEATNSVDEELMKIGF